jgi:hypothetical protein
MAATRKTPKSTAANGKSNGAAGTTLADICKGLKMEPRTARRILRNAKFEVEGGRWVFGKQQAERVKKLLKDKQAAE